MQFDFHSIMDRSGRDSIAVDYIPVSGATVNEGFDTIPMWVADMNFPTVPSVTRAILDRAAHPAFGYFSPTDAYYQAIINWQQTRNKVTGLLPEHIGYENGVLGGVVSAVGAICSPGDSILVHAPTYIGFTAALENHGYRLVHSYLEQDEAGVWRMDFGDMEQKLKEGRIHTAILCSPHNPCGRVWERWELEQAMALFQKYNVYVISDEIWSDLILNGNIHIPTQSVSDDAKMRTIALYAPSKTFNLAGLEGSYHIIYDDWLRARVRKEGSLSHYNSMNVLSMHALIGAYSAEGGAWVDELRQVLGENIRFAYEYITARFSGVSLAMPEATYMLYLDCQAWCEAHGRTLDELLAAGISVGVIWQDGRPFHHPWAIRMNLALPHSRVEEAFARLDQHVFNKN